MRKMYTVAAMALVVAGCSDAPETPRAAPSSAPAPVAAPAGNGVAALTADQILARVKAALVKAGSFHVAGTTIEDGEKLAADLRVSGPDVAGSLSTGPARVELLAVGGHRYIKPNEAFWSITGAGLQAHAIAQRVGDRWVKVDPADQSLTDMFSVATVDNVLAADGKLTKGTTQDIAGVPTIGLVDGGEPGGTLYIATSGEAYPVRLAGPDGSGATFGEFGHRFAEIKAPAAGDVVDAASLPGK